MNPVPTYETQVQFYDLQGKLILKKEIQFEGNRAIIKAKNLSNGIYLLTIGGMTAGKIVIHK